MSFTPPSSRLHRIVLVIGIVCLLTTFAGVILVAAHKYDNQLPTAGSAHDVAATAVDAHAKARIAEKFGKLPLSFEINKGQIDRFREVPVARSWLRSVSDGD